MKLISKFVIAVLASVCLGGIAHAAPATYTFSGIGAGTINGVGFSGTFTFVFTADTSAIDTSGAPFFRLNNIGGTFTEGSYTATLDPTVTIVATASALFPRINFFNATFDNGLGIDDPSLATYELATSFGPLFASDGSLTPTFGGGSFLTTGGDKISMTGDETLTFTAVVPEPSPLALLVVALIAMPLTRRMARKHASVA